MPTLFPADEAQPHLAHKLSQLRRDRTELIQSFQTTNDSAEHNQPAFPSWKNQDPSNQSLRKPKSGD